MKTATAPAALAPILTLVLKLVQRPVLALGLMLGLMLGLALGASPALSAESSVVVLDMTGGTCAFSAGPMAGTALEIMDFLSPGDGVDVPKGAVLVLNYLDAGQREAITGPAKLTVGQGQSTLTQGAPAQVKREKLDYMPAKAKVSLAEAQNFGNVAFRDVAAKPSPPAIKVLSLSGTAVLPGTKPALSWLPVEGADGYAVALKDESGAELARVPSAASPWSPDPTLLSPGRTLSWTLTAQKDGQAQAEAKGEFTVLSKEGAASLKAEEGRLKAKRPAGSLEGQLFLSLLYQSYGLNDAAAGVLQDLARKNPGNPGIKRRLEAINPSLAARP